MKLSRSSKAQSSATMPDWKPEIRRRLANLQLIIFAFRSKLTAEAFKGSPIETEYKKLSPTPNEFPNFVTRVIAMELKSYDFGAAQLKATKAPFLFIHGDADGVRLDHIAEMFRLKGDEIHGDLRPRSESRLAVLPNATHVTLMEKASTIIPMVNDFLDAKSQKQ